MCILLKVKGHPRTPKTYVHVQISLYRHIWTSGTVAILLNSSGEMQESDGCGDLIDKAYVYLTPITATK